ncbi:MAG: ABC transporter substrate-binding protein [Conexivisphaerales archaeon]
MTSTWRKITNRKAISTLAVAIIIVIVVVAIAAAVYYVTLKPSQVTAQPITLAPTSLVALQGSSISFSVSGLVSKGEANVTFGDGHFALTNSTTTYSYQYPGRYLVAASEVLNGKVVTSTYNSTRLIQVTPQVDPSLAPLISIPVITFNQTRNPGAPFVQVNQPVYLYGGFLEAPTGNNMSIIKYVWNFGNGLTQTVTANSTTFEPEKNPVNVTYASPGLYPVSLTLYTQNASSMQTYSYTVYQTIAVSSSTLSFKLFEYSGNVPNPNVINVAENVAGGPYSFDPQVDYESVGFEVISNIFATLLVYNGSSTTSFIPMVASQVPSVQNGGINSNYTQYTFTIRSGLAFSNGDPLTAYDVWYSMIRDMLFVGGAPGTPDWILAQYLVPGATIGVPIMTAANDTADFNAIMSAVTYSNSSQTVTFHLVRPLPPQLFFTAIADPLGAGIVDAAWLEQVGAGITFTPAGFYNYQNQGNEGSYNTKVQNDPVTSGPYMIQSYVPGQSITLVPNPGFPGVPGVPKPTDTVVIQWVKDPETTYNLFASGQADILGGASPPLPTNYFPLLTNLEGQGQASLYSFPSLSDFFFVFTLNISVSQMKTDFGPQYNIPPDYFANLNVRKAFAYAFNYTNYIDNIVGNQKYHVNFGQNYAGVIIQGLPYYVPSSQLQNVPTFNLTYAKQLLEQSGEYNISINIPVAVSSGDTVDYAAAQMWAAAMNQIDPNIQMTPVYVPFSTIIAYEVPGSNPMPIYYLGWIADYPYPADFVDAMYKQGGTYPAPDGFSTEYFNATGHPDQAQMFAQMNQLIEQADTTANSTLAAQLYKQAEQIAINLYMYVYTIQPNAFWVVKPYMNGYQGQISYEENPMIGGAADSLFYWWVKG